VIFTLGMGGDDHRCEWRDRAEALEAQLGQTEAQLTRATVELNEATTAIASMSERMTAMQGTLEKFQRHVFGQRSEKMPPVAQEIRDPARAEAARIAALQKRRENAEKKRQLVTRKIEHKVRDEQKTCPKCGGHDFSRPRRR